MSSVDDYSLVPWQEQDNPFLVNMPVVHIVRGVRSMTDGEVTNLDTQCKRVLTRVGNNRVYPSVHKSNELLASNGSGSLLNSMQQLKPHL